MKNQQKSWWKTNTEHFFTNFSSISSSPLGHFHCFFLFSWSYFILFCFSCHLLGIWSIREKNKNNKNEWKRKTENFLFLHLSGNKYNIVCSSWKANFQFFSSVVVVCCFFHKKFPNIFFLRKAKRFSFLFFSSVNVNTFLLCVICVRVTHTANYSRIIDSTEFPRKIVCFLLVFQHILWEICALTFFSCFHHQFRHLNYLLCMKIMKH